MTAPYLSPFQALLQSWRIQLRHRLHFAWFVLAMLVASIAVNHWFKYQLDQHQEQLNQVIEQAQKQTEEQRERAKAPSPVAALPTSVTVELRNLPAEVVEDLKPLQIKMPASGQDPTYIVEWHREGKQGKVVVKSGQALTWESAKQLNATRDSFQTALAWAESQRLQEAAKQLPDFRFAPSVSVDTDANAMQREVQAMLPSALRMVLALLFFFGAAFLAGSTLGVEWDLQRAASNLEGWALSYHPLWALFLAQGLTRATQATVVGLVVFSPTLFYSFDVSWWVWLVASLVLGWIVFGLTALLGMWSLLSTMLFHHRYGRMFGRLALSPFSLGAVMLFRSSLIVAAMAGMSSWAAQQPALWSWTHVTWAGLGLGTFLLVMALALVPVVEWRIGVRRIGLRKL